MVDLLGKRLGDFEIVRELGRGGMGIVYEARQVSLNRKVALKVLGSGLGLTAKAVQRFRREAEAAAKLHHTNIVPVYATGEQDGTHFYAMELIDGPSLDRVLRQLRQTHGAKPAPPPSAPPQPSTVDESPPEALPAWVEQSFAPAAPPSSAEAPTGQSSSDLGSGSGYFDTVTRMIAEVADGLEYAHGQGVIHRDIKPSNLLLAPSGRLSINDFGLARILEQPGMTLTGEFVGTPKYMSPEQITAGRTLLDHRTDIYSLGATLYELLTWQPPFSGERREQLLGQILHKEPRPPRRLNKKVPVDLETICLKCLEKDPDRRYQTAGQLAEDLRRYLNRFAISARRAGPVARARKWVQRHPGLAAALVCALLASLAAGFFAWQAHVAEQRHLAENRVAEQRHLAENRQNAIEKAALAAWHGNFDDAEKAAQEAERYGASPGQSRLMRGLVAYYRFREAEAIEHLELAVDLLPKAESVAARGLLIMAYSSTGRSSPTVMERSLRELEPIAPVTLLDYLFKGRALGEWWDPKQGLQLLDEAVRGKPTSVIALLLRAQTRMNLAVSGDDPRRADQALDDVKKAGALLPEQNPEALVDSCWLHQQGAVVYEIAGLTGQFQAARAQAGRDAEALRAYPDLPSALQNRMWYFWYLDQKDRMLAESRRHAREKDFMWVGEIHALILYWRGAAADLQEARDVLEVHRGHGNADLVRCFVLADLEGSEAGLTAYRQMMAGDLGDYERLRGHSVLLLLGEKDQAKQESRKDRQRGVNFIPRFRDLHNKLLDYCAGDCTDADLLQVAAAPRLSWKLCFAHYYIGLSRLADGDRAGAREQFEKAIATRATWLTVYDLSVVLLARLEKDRNWPPWIPP